MKRKKKRKSMSAAKSQRINKVQVGSKIKSKRLTTDALPADQHKINKMEQPPMQIMKLRKKI